MWELLACRSLGVWERGDAQGAAKVNSLAAASIVLLSVVLQWGWQPEVTGQDLLWSGGLPSAQDWEVLHTCAHVSMGLNPVLPALLA